MDFKERAKVKSKEDAFVVGVVFTGEGRGVGLASKKPSRGPTSNDLLTAV